MPHKRRLRRRPNLGEWLGGGLCLLLAVGLWVGALYGLNYLVENFWFGMTWELGLIVLALLTLGTLLAFAAYYLLIIHPSSRVLRQISACQRQAWRDQTDSDHCQR